MTEAGESTQNSGYAIRRLDKATRYVSDYWFPVNPELLEKIRLGISAGSYGTDTKSLVDDIRSDFSLFTFCLKRLVEMLRQDGALENTRFDPIAMLEKAEMKQLEQILSIETHEVSKHSIDSGAEFQVARFREAMLSATTAESLAQSYAVDSDSAYSAALLRQLGYVLVAWNYPSLYQAALTSLTADDNLDLVLARSLGFSPGLLAMRVLHQWGVPEQSLNALGLFGFESPEETEVFEAIGETIDNLCKVGEALARASDPEHYPSAADDWQVAKLEVTSRLGPKGMEIIRERYTQNCESYLNLAPEMFNPALICEEVLVSDSSHQDLGGKNPFLVLCDEKVQNELRKLYKYIEELHGAQSNVRFLVREIITRCGFSCGCVYTVDPALMMLVPQAEIGTSKGVSYKAVDYSIVRSDADLVALAFQNADPVIGYKKGISGDTKTLFAGVFGTSQRVGVLYLEFPNFVSNRNDALELVHFKALRFALNECLGI